MSQDEHTLGFGHWRVYFNAHAAAPLVWCVSSTAGRWEIAVTAVVIQVPGSRTVYAPAKQPGDDSPSAWLEVSGDLMLLRDGTAYVRGRS